MRQTEYMEQLLAESPEAAFLLRLAKRAGPFDPGCEAGIAAYTQRFLDLHGVGIAEAYLVYEAFIRSYNKDIAAFAETGSYPHALRGTVSPIDRLDYDLVLLLSCIFSPHRRRIMDLLHRWTTETRTAAFVGCGPGLEIALLKERFQRVEAFDLDLNPRLADLHGDVAFFEEAFPSPRGQTPLDAVFLIEILEHLDAPDALLADAAGALGPGGRLYLTTATNIPQFDHLYNFSEDHAVFERRLGELGLRIDRVEILTHQYMDIEIGAKNHVYALTRV